MRFFAFVIFLPLAGCSIDYYFNSSIDNLPCDQNKCLPGFFCHESKCKRVGVVKLNQFCHIDDECETGSKCLKPVLANCQNELNCRLMRTRGELEAKCRKSCDFSPDASPCPSGQRCMTSEGIQGGICLDGTCDSDSDCGTNAQLQNKCLDQSNGVGSGICGLSCNPLKCKSGACPDCPASIQNCEPMGDLSAFLCVPSGKEAAFALCDDVNLFCAPGSFCNSGQCTPYCDTLAPSCQAGGKCFPLYVGSKIGFCANITL